MENLIWKYIFVVDEGKNGLQVFKTILMLKWNLFIKEKKCWPILFFFFEVKVISLNKLRNM